MTWLVLVWDVHVNPLRSAPQGTYLGGEFLDTDKLDAVMAQHVITHVVHLVSTTLSKSSN